MRYDAFRNVTLTCEKCNKKDIVAVRFLISDEGKYDCQISFVCLCGSKEFRVAIPPDVIQLLNQMQWRGKAANDNLI